MRKNEGLALLCATTLGFAGVALAHDKDVRATAEVRDADGNVLGTVSFISGPNGTLITGHLTGLPPGAHGFHVHEVGECEAPDFTSAGDHYNPSGCRHGFLVSRGPHPGDLPNLWVDEDGDVTFDFFNPKLKLKQALKGDGVALVVHDMPDDYVSQPSGAAGPRIGCGVLERASE